MAPAGSGAGALAAAFDLDADGITVGKGLGLAGPDFNAFHAWKLILDTLGQALYQGFQQIGVFRGADFNQRLAQLAVVQHGANVIVLDILRNGGVEFGINMQGLTVNQLVVQHADRGLHHQIVDKYTACSHGKNKVSGPSVVTGL